MPSHKIGGLAGLIEALLYIIGFVFLGVFLAPAMNEASSDLDRLQVLLDNKVLYQVWNLLIYVVFGIVLIPLTAAIRGRFPNDAFWSHQIAPVLGYIWSGLVIASGMIMNVGLETIESIHANDPQQAYLVWQIIDAISNGLGGGVEVVGGVWVLLISLSGLRASVLPKLLNGLGLLVGTVGVLTMVPGLQDLGAIFGLTQIIWFGWLGGYLLRNANH